VDHDRNDPEPVLARAPATPWELQEILGWSLLVALLLLVVAYVAAGIIQSGASPQENPLEVTTYYASDWASPYFTIFPLAALAIAWWQLRRWGPVLTPSDGVEGEAGGAEGGETEAGAVHVARARMAATASVVALVVIVFAAIGVVVTSLLLFPQSEASGSQVWPSEAETLASAATALLLSGVGLAIALSLRGEASARLATDTEEAVEPEDVPAAE
jgi:hypothetical protein